MLDLFRGIGLHSCTSCSLMPNDLLVFICKFMCLDLGVSDRIEGLYGEPFVPSSFQGLFLVVCLAPNLLLTMHARPCIEIGLVEFAFIPLRLLPLEPALYLIPFNITYTTSWLIGPL